MVRRRMLHQERVQKQYSARRASTMVRDNTREEVLCQNFPHKQHYSNNPKLVALIAGAHLGLQPFAMAAMAVMPWAVSAVTDLPGGWEAGAVIEVQQDCKAVGAMKRWGDMHFIPQQSYLMPS